MPIYQVTPLASNHKQLSDALVAWGHETGMSWIELPNSAGWLVAFGGTTIELSNLLAVTGQPKGEKSPTGSTLVVAITSYYGRASSDIWEWLKTRFESGG